MLVAFSMMFFTVLIAILLSSLAIGAKVILIFGASLIGLTLLPLAVMLKYGFVSPPKPVRKTKQTHKKFKGILK